MENEHENQTEMKDTSLYYVVGAIAVAAVVAGIFLLKPKAPQTAAPGVTQPITEQPVPQPTKGPITKLSCDGQYYNPVIGFPKFYLSVEGGDVAPAKKVDCEFTVSVNNKVVETNKVSSPLTDAPERGGSTFRCTTKELTLQSGVPTKVDVALKDDASASSSCSATFVFPAQ